jgi:hypothetical protein
MKSMISCALLLQDYKAIKGLRCRILAVSTIPIVFLHVMGMVMDVGNMALFHRKFPYQKISSSELTRKYILEEGSHHCLSVPGSNI